MYSFFKFLKDAKTSWVIIVSLIIFAIPAVLPLFHPGFFSLHDETHIVDLYQMFRAFETQGFPPRWAPDFNFGLGHPYFNFYYHLPFYITSIFMFLGFSMIQSFKLYLFLVILSAILGFYFFISQHISKIAALVAATLYLYTPYFAVDLYVRGALGELAVLSILPWAALALNYLITSPSILRFLISSLSISLLAISHNVLNIFVFPIIFAYGMVLIFNIKREIKKRVILLIATFVFGILLSSYYVLPALMERQFISSYEQIKIEDHFPFIKQLIFPHWGYGTSHWGPGDDFSMQIGILNLLAVFLSIILFKVMKKNRIILAFFIVTFFIAVVLMNYRTLPFWNLHPVLRYFQFPWRLLIITTFSTSILAGFVLEKLLGRFNLKRKILYVGLVLISILSLNVWYFRPSQFKQISDERYLELYFANRTLQGNGERGYLSKEYLGFSEDFIPPTKWQKKRLNYLPKSLVEAETNASIVYSRDNLTYNIELNTKEDNTLYIYNSYFPGWTVLLNNKNLEVLPATDLGIISFKVPKGEHDIILSFENTFIRNLANFLSLISLLIFTLLLAKSMYRK